MKQKYSKLFSEKKSFCFSDKAIIYFGKVMMTSHEKYDEFFPLLTLEGRKILLVFLSDHNKPSLNLTNILRAAFLHTEGF